jgi:pyruvate/2-oxoglutarate dehydrogenase complex dihydrolipoamide acyltransferase (E2) component
VAQGERVFISPLARRLAREAGLAWQGLTGSGPLGRIVAGDVEKAKLNPPAPAAAAAAGGNFPTWVRPPPNPRASTSHTANASLTTRLHAVWSPVWGQGGASSPSCEPPPLRGTGYPSRHF